MFGGGFVNYYQNTIVFISEPRIDIFSTIQRDLRMQKYLLGKHSPLETYDQTRLFNTINSRKIDAVLRPLEEEAVKFAATSFVGAGVGRAAGWAFGKIWNLNLLNSTRSGWNNIFNQIQTGGKTFEQYKAVRGGTKTLGWIKTSTGTQRISIEFHHMFIPQRIQKAYNLPNWLVNNRINVWKVNTIQHSLIDPYRFNFMKAGIKSDIGWFNRYNWFTNF